MWRGSYIECLLNGESQILTVTVDAPDVRYMNIVINRVSRIKGDNVSCNQSDIRFKRLYDGTTPNCPARLKSLLPASRFPRVKYTYPRL